MTTQATIILPTPKQDLETSSAFECTEASVKDWVTQLPMGNLGQTTKLLFEALTELNRVRLLPAKRLAILELLRQPIYHCSRSLSRHYLNKPIVLPPQAKQVTKLADTLHHTLATGYCIVANHAAALGKRSGTVNPKQLIAQSLHRAITDISLNIVRHYQLYNFVTAGRWQLLHQCYRLAQHHSAQQITVTDSEYGDSSIHKNYLRILLLGAARPNQLRQEDFMQLFKPLLLWAEQCVLGPLVETSPLAVPYLQDSPPIYQCLLEQETPALGLDTHRLVNHLEKLRSNTERGQLKVQDGNTLISFDLLGHLELAWREMSKRNFMRMDSDQNLEVCVGLSTTHHFISGEINLDDLTNDTSHLKMSMRKENPFLKTKSHEPHRQKDIWDSAYESNLGSTNVALESIDFHIRAHDRKEKNEKKYHNHPVQVVNSSPHGYCINWPSDAPIAIKAGEICGVRETGNNHWSIAVIRWVTHSDNDVTQLGLELISPSASPYGARPIKRTGAPEDYLRVLVLPAAPSLKIPMTLLTPRVPFQEGQKVMLSLRGKQTQIQLIKKLNDIGAYNQFEFRKLGGIKEPQATPSENKSSFDTLWKNL